MSNTGGAVRFGDGAIMYFEYQGSSDTAEYHLYPTVDELHANWRHHVWTPNCKYAGNGACAEEPIEMLALYGGGTHWKGSACRKCRQLIEGIVPADCDEQDGLPDWNPFGKD
jgi:hypothetical protein